MEILLLLKLIFGIVLLFDIFSLFRSESDGDLVEVSHPFDELRKKGINAILIPLSIFLLLVMDLIQNLDLKISFALLFLSLIYLAMPRKTAYGENGLLLNGQRYSKDKILGITKKDDAFSIRFERYGWLSEKDLEDGPVARKLSEDFQVKPHFVFMVIKEHPWGREMLSQLIDSGFKPALIIQEESETGEIERKKFEFRIGNNQIGKLIAMQAKEQNIPIETVPIHNDEQCMKHIEEVAPQLIVFGGTRIIRGKILEYGEERDGVLNSHPGLLPECRGSASPAWSIYHDIPIGSSCHFCSSDIDAGDLVGRCEIDIKRGDTYQDVCYKTLVTAATLMKEALKAYSEGKLNELRTAQGESSNPVFRYDSEVEKKSIQKMKEMEYKHYVNNNDGGVAIGEVLMIIMTIIMAVVLLKSFT